MYNTERGLKVEGNLKEKKNKSKLVIVPLTALLSC